MSSYSSFISKVRSAQFFCGTHINLTDCAISELEAQVGFDFIWVDMEHTYISEEVLHQHLLASHAGGTPIVVRVPPDDLSITKHVLEMGIDGIVFPMVRNAAHAKELLSWTLYPPYGTRGCGPKGAVAYGLSDERAYYGPGHMELCRFVQIETKTAAEDAIQIAALPYLDGCVLGMHDLSGSLGDLGNIFSDANTRLANQAIRAFKAQKKTVGISTFATDEETLRRYHSMGINMITTGADYEYIRKGALETLHLVRAIGEAPVES